MKLIPNLSLIILLIFTGWATNLSAQGCSDAGFCTIDGLKPQGSDSTSSIKTQIKIGVFIGKADHAIFASGAYVEFNKQVNDKLGFDLKLTSLAQSGNGISTFGVSDVYANLKYKLTHSFTGVVGIKIPLMRANKSLDGLPLPMDYQASLGTFDLVVGLGYKWKGIELVAAWQQPLTQNDNQFFSSVYPEESELRRFQSTHKFQRKGDVLLRLSYPIKLGEKWKFTPSILPIYHLGNDLFTDELDVEREIEGSEGLTLNGNLYLDYQLNAKNSLQLNTGSPFIVRDERPDGLTRSYIITLEYKFKF